MLRNKLIFQLQKKSTCYSTFVPPANNGVRTIYLKGYENPCSIDTRLLVRLYYSGVSKY